MIQERSITRHEIAPSYHPKQCQQSNKLQTVDHGSLFGPFLVSPLTTPYHQAQILGSMVPPPIRYPEARWRIWQAL
jgi:hypothetical protein